MTPRGINTLFIEPISALPQTSVPARGRTAPAVVCGYGPRGALATAGPRAPEVKRWTCGSGADTQDRRLPDLRRFRWLEPPPRPASWTPKRFWRIWGVDSLGRITATGRKMLAFPVHPRYAACCSPRRNVGAFTKPRSSPP